VCGRSVESSAKSATQVFLVSIDAYSFKLGLLWGWMDLELV